jgi:hypothetical protein
MSHFLDTCKSLGLINLATINSEKRGRMAVVATNDSRLHEKNISKMGEFYMTFNVIDPSIRSATRCSLFTKNFIQDLSFSRGDILVGKFYVCIYI